MEVRVSKIDAARRQIETAIHLLFDGGDLVSIHTLASAGSRIVRDLCRRSSTPMHQKFESMIRPGMKGEYFEAVNRAANFFKHADRDADEIFDGLDERVNEVLLFLACCYYRDLGHAPTQTMLEFMRWVSYLHPNFVADEDPSKPIILTSNAIAWLRSAPRHEQLKAGKVMLSGKLPAA